MKTEVITICLRIHYYHRFGKKSCQKEDVLLDFWSYINGAPLSLHTIILTDRIYEEDLLIPVAYSFADILR